MMMARLSLLNSLPRLASMAPFLCLIVAQWECPDMAPPSRCRPGGSESWERLISNGTHLISNHPEMVSATATRQKLWNIEKLEFAFEFFILLALFASSFFFVEIDRLSPCLSRFRGLFHSEINIAQVV